MQSINFKEIISKNSAFYRKHSQQYKKKILVLLGIITFIFIKCNFSKDINVDKNALVYSISWNLSMTPCGRTYLAELPFQNGTRVRQSAWELHVSPDVLAIEIKSQNVVFFYMVSLFSLLLNKIDSTRNRPFFSFCPQMLRQVLQNTVFFKPSNMYQNKWGQSQNGRGWKGPLWVI